MKKRALSLVLTLTMALTMLPATALAAGKAGLIQLSAPTELSMGTYYREDGTSVSIPSMRGGDQAYARYPGWRSGSWTSKLDL